MFKACFSHISITQPFTLKPTHSLSLPSSVQKDDLTICVKSVFFPHTIFLDLEEKQTPSLSPSSPVEKDNLTIDAKTRAQLEAKCRLLREGKGASFQNAFTLTSIAIQAMFAL